MRKRCIVKKILAHLAMVGMSILGFFFVTLKFVVYVIGLSTVPDDAMALGVKLKWLMSFADQIPALAYFMFMLIFFVYLMITTLNIPSIRGFQSKKKKITDLAVRARDAAHDLSNYRCNPLLYDRYIVEYRARAMAVLNDLMRHGFTVPTALKDSEKQIELMDAYLSATATFIIEGNIPLAKLTAAKIVEDFSET